MVILAGDNGGGAVSADAAASFYHALCNGRWDGAAYDEDGERSGDEGGACLSS
ncbi:MAG: hypothetical protein M3036_04185 [Bifidobacteriales bacterium]|nr:hypothetical protein [Bifidobacteriales bacterium]